MRKTPVGAGLVLLAAAILAPAVLRADEFSSPSFRVLDPVIAPAEYSTSGSFQLWGTISQLAIGTSTSASFSLNPGFLAYPFVSTPSVSATAGDGSVALSWSASEGFVGWTVSGYDVGQSTTAGGPYTYGDVGNVTSSNRAGLANGTTYYFVVLPKDASGNRIGTSTEASAVPAAAGGAGGTGGGGSTAPKGTAVFSGRAFPYSAVTLLKDGRITASTVAGGDAAFRITVSGLSTGSYIFALYGENREGNSSPSLSFPITLSGGVTTEVHGVFIAPVIATDKSEVRRGDTVSIFGQTVPQSDVIISVNSEPELFASARADRDGVYNLDLDTSVLALGQHSTKAKAALTGQISSFSRAAAFVVGDRTVLASQASQKLRGDVNDDGRVNLLDFSIAAYWFKRQLTGGFSDSELEDLSGDGVVNLVDFSIMAYYWTG